MKPILTVRLGGVALIAGAVAFMAVFSFLAARFDYPAVLDGPPSLVLPALLATGTAGRMFRSLTTVVAPVAAINNYLLPLWMIAFGVILLRHREPPVAAVDA